MRKVKFDPKGEWIDKEEDGDTGRDQLLWVSCRDFKEDKRN